MSHLSTSGTFSKDPSSWGFYEDTYASCGYGDAVSLSDKRVYVDWVSGLGANILGQDNRDFLKAVERQLYNGITFSITNHLEHEVADLLVEKVGSQIWNPDNTLVRFAKTGSEACAMAVRLARWYTGRSVVASFGYHGWMSEFISAEPPAHGIPIGYKRDLVRKIKWNDKTSVHEAFRRGNVAALIVEHPPQETDDDWYSFLRAMCEVNGTVFIMDEVVTGLRYGTGGVSAHYNIEPDLICMGKALGNGLPISAVMGKKSILEGFRVDDPVFCSSTHWGEALSLAAAKFVLNYWNRDGINYINYIGGALMESLSNAGWDVYGDPVRSLLRFTDDYERAFFIHGMRHHGHLFNRPNFPTLSHSMNDVKEVAEYAQLLKDEYERIDKDTLKEILKDHLPRVLFRSR